MGIVKITRNTYGGPDYLKAACNYILNKKAVAFGGYMVDNHDANRAFDQMMTVKRFYHKSGDNPLVHFIVSYDKDENKSVGFYIDCSREFAKYFKDDYQVLWCLHKKETVKSLYHTHIIVNSVNINNGNLIQPNWSYCSKFRKFTEKITECRMSYYFDIPDDYSKEITELNKYDFE